MAGIAALLKAQYPSATFQELKGRMIASATPITAMQGLISSGGRANAAAALTTVAQPVLVIGNVTWSDGGNNMIEPGETGTMVITLENIWLNASGITVTMTPLSANLIVNNGSVNYPNITSGSSQSANFGISTAVANGHQLYQFKLDINTAEGYAVTRYYQFGMGALGNGIVTNGTIGTSEQDDYQVFFIDVPVGARKLSINSTSPQDIDLMLKFNSIPVFDFTNYWWPNPPLGTKMANTIFNTGNESISITNPVAGLYYVLVLNPNKVANVPFTLQADMIIDLAVPSVLTKAAPALSGGGCSINTSSAFDPMMLVLLLLSAFFRLASKSSLLFRARSLRVNK